MEYLTSSVFSYQMSIYSVNKENYLGKVKFFVRENCHFYTKMLPIFAFFCFGQILVFDEKLFNVDQSSFRSTRLNQDRFQPPKIETRLIKNSFKTFIE